MAISNGYATLSDVKAALRITDTVDDALLELSIEAASRQIDGFCERVFTQSTATRIYRPTDAFTVDIDDLQTLTTLKTDSNPLLFKIDMERAGHGGKSGRYDQLHELAFEYAFLLWQLGVEKPP